MSGDYSKSVEQPRLTVYQVARGEVYAEVAADLEGLATQYRKEASTSSKAKRAARALTFLAAKYRNKSTEGGKP